jgi:peroxiredoxin
VIRWIDPAHTPSGCPAAPRGYFAAGAVALLLSLTPAAAGGVTAFDPDTQLSLEPLAPRSGEEVLVSFRPGAALAGQPRLVVRARVRTAADYDDAVVVTMGELTASADGLYRGTMRLPEGAVYAALAIENGAGTHIEYREGWHILIHDADGAPTFESLLQRVHDTRLRDTRIAAGAARRLTELYPDSVAAWSQLLFLEVDNATVQHADSARRAHLPRVRNYSEQLKVELARTPDAVTAEAAARLVFYASAARDTTTQRIWREWLLLAHPEHPSAVQQRVFNLARESRGDTGALINALEELWQRVGPSHGQLAWTGFQAAMRNSDPELLHTWGLRVISVAPERQAAVAAAWGRLPALRVAAAAALADELVAISAQTRPLEIQADEWETRLNAQTAALQAHLGRMLLSQGDTVAAMALLQEAASATWDPALFLAVATERLQVGDTTGALPLLASAAADPLMIPAHADSLRSAFAQHSSAGAWEQATEAAVRRLHDFLAAARIERPVPADLSVQAEDGSRLRLARDEGLTFIASWSRFCAASVDQLPELARLARELGARGIRVITVVDEPHSSAVAEFIASRNLEFPVYFDADRSIRRDLGVFGTSTFMLLDRETIRFRSTSPVHVLRQAWALQQH